MSNAAKKPLAGVWHPYARSATLGALLVLSSSEAWARRQGITAVSCTGCHGGSDSVQVTARFEPETVDPGETTTLIVEVADPTMVAAGIGLFGPGIGSLSVPPGQSLNISGDWVTHTTPKAATSGKVEFRIDWTAPDEVGVARFEVGVLATNGNNQVNGDRAGGASLILGYGCEPVTVYWDFDGDGFGREDAWTIACEPEEKYSLIPGDCADGDAERYPGAEERCNGLDDDCDGEIDEGVPLGVFYRDADGDGFGNPATRVETCTPEPGYVDNGLDCNDNSADINPDAPEVCDFVDNDCDDRIDEGVRPICGVGLCARESNQCDSIALCVPGEPFEEVCNGLDDDCDGEIDEDTCPTGQRCFENACVNVDDIPLPSPSGPPTTPTGVGPVPTPAPTEPGLTGPVGTPPISSTTPASTDTVAPVESVPNSGAGGSRASSGGCSVKATPVHLRTICVSCFGVMFLFWCRRNATVRGKQERRRFFRN